MADLINTGLFIGNLGNDPVEVNTTIATTTLIDGLDAVKTADRSVWVNGELTYTIVITNESGLDYESINFEDALDPLVVNVVTDSVYIDGNQTAYTYTAGVLRFAIGDIPNGESRTIVFKVVRV